MVILLQQKNFGPNVIYFVLGTLVIVARLTWQFPVCHRFIRTYQKCVAPCTRQISPTWLRPVHLGSDLIPLMPVLAPTWLASAGFLWMFTNEIHDIGTEIFLLTKNDHNSTQKAPKSMIPERIKKSRTFPII